MELAVASHLALQHVQVQTVSRDSGNLTGSRALAVIHWHWQGSAIIRSRLRERQAAAQHYLFFRAGATEDCSIGTLGKLLQVICNYHLARLRVSVSPNSIPHRELSARLRRSLNGTCAELPTHVSAV